MMLWHIHIALRHDLFSMRHFYALISVHSLSQAYLTAREREEQELAARELQQRLEEVLRKNEAATRSQSEGDEEMVENIFGFLPSTIGGQEGQAPEGFEVRAATTGE